MTDHNREMLPTSNNQGVAQTEHQEARQTEHVEKISQKQQLLEDNMERISLIVEQLKDGEVSNLFEFLRERIVYPESFVTMLGETSSGKSSLINGLFGEDLLFTGAQPTTGTIIELMDDSSLQEKDYCAVTKDATLHTLSKEQFEEFSKELPDQFVRLRLLLPEFPDGLQGLRLFDTPGYGAIQENHEEILKSFIPNSDVLIYVINYRVGVNKSDAEFIDIIQELLRDDMTFYLVINRVPAGATKEDQRVKEIRNHIQDLLHQSVPVYLIPGILMENEDEVPLPKASSLWKDVKKEILSTERQEALQETFFAYQKNLLYDIQGILEKRKLEKVATKEEIKLIEEALQEFKEKEPVIQEKIDETFSRVSDTTNKMVAKSASTIANDIGSEIQASNRWTNQQECTGYVEAHLLPLLAKNEMKEIKTYIERELQKLNDEIESMLNTAVQNFERRIVFDNLALENLAVNMGNRIAQRFTDQALNLFFRQYGGRGGAGAGVANAAKKGLKKLGNLVGKTFSRETHNKLAHLLKTIGVTSSKAITAAAVVIIEGFFYIIEVTVWKAKLSKRITKAMNVWESEIVEAVKGDLEELKEHNLAQVAEIFAEYEKSFSLDGAEGEDKEKVEVIETQLAAVQVLIEELMEGEVQHV